MRRTLCALAFLATLVAGCAGLSQGPEVLPAETSEPRLERQSYTSFTEEKCQYFVYLPRGYDSDPDRDWPVMMFLHGDGERGNAHEDLDWVLVHGPLYEAWIQKRDLPFVIVAPQLPLFGREQTVPYIRDRKVDDIPKRVAVGIPPRPEEFPNSSEMVGATPDPDLPFGPEGPPDGWPRREEDLLTILDQVPTLYRVDPDRIYLTGISYGGFGTWYLASRHPERFAAIAPVVGWGHPDLMPPLADPLMPVWVFAGGRDPAVLVQHFYLGLNALEKLGNDEVLFTIHADSNHDAWRRIYAGQDVYDWLLQQTR